MSVRYSSVERAARLARARALQAAPGVLDFFIDDAHIGKLFPGKKYTRKKFSFQISDQLPGWLQMRTNIGGYRLGADRAGTGGGEG